VTIIIPQPEEELSLTKRCRKSRQIRSNVAMLHQKADTFGPAASRIPEGVKNREMLRD
jgi:hypothetical protein